MKKNHNGLWIVTSVCLCLCLTSTISAMQMGGFDIDVGNGESSSCNGRNSSGIRAVGRIRGKITGRLETTHQKLLYRTIRPRTMDISMILI